MIELGQLRDAVVEAARSVLYAAPGAHDRLASALAALDAAQSRPREVETVRVAVWACKPEGSMAFCLAGSVEDNEPAYESTRLGTITLHLDTEAKG